MGENEYKDRTLIRIVQNKTEENLHESESFPKQNSNPLAYKQISICNDTKSFPKSYFRQQTGLAKKRAPGRCDGPSRPVGLRTKSDVYRRPQKRKTAAPFRAGSAHPLTGPYYGLTGTSRQADAEDLLRKQMTIRVRECLAGGGNRRRAVR